MLNWFHDQLGFGGSILIPFFAFIIAICWISGVAGISEELKSEEKFSWKFLIAIFFPPYPIVWLFIDMYRQHSYLHKTK